MRLVCIQLIFPLILQPPDSDQYHNQLPWSFVHLVCSSMLECRLLSIKPRQVYPQKITPAYIGGWIRSRARLYVLENRRISCRSWDSTPGPSSPQPSHFTKSDTKIDNNRLVLSGFSMCHKFYYSNFCMLFTQAISPFYVIFPTEQRDFSLYIINWLVLIIEECVYCAVRTQFFRRVRKIAKRDN